MLIGRVFVMSRTMILLLLELDIAGPVAVYWPHVVKDVKHKHVFTTQEIKYSAS